MVNNYNTSLNSRLIQKFNIKDGLFFDNVMSSKIIPVVPVLPIVNATFTNSRTTSGGAVLYSTPSDKDFYLTNLTLGIIKDATCDTATGEVSITVVIDRVTSYVLSIPILTLTAQNNIITINFQNNPIKLDRSSSITLGSNTFSAGNFVRTISVQGYIENTLS